ncbi:MAG: aminopeptidase P family protein [Proteobacteria bacterium]|nr:aminopeptidase P family protein [Pseudomonadota bacterium]
MFVGFDASTIRYLTAYPLVPNERPFCVVVDSIGHTTLFTPLLKERDARVRGRANVVCSYQEYPGKVHPMKALADLINQTASRRILLERDGHSSPFGYVGPEVASMLQADAVVDPAIVHNLRKVKTAEEIGLLRTASDWSVFAQGCLHAQVQPGRSESKVSGTATGQAVGALRQAYGGTKEFDKPLSVSAGFGGQIGPDGTCHHIQLDVDPVMNAGDMLITRVGAQVGGYYSDIERTMICGTPSAAVADLFKRGVDIHHYALELVTAGARASDVDRAVFARFQALGLEREWRHHVGHSVGLLEREPPYLDIGSVEVLEPGMLVTVEPGLYRDGVGGFRHSDCVLITEQGAEILTEYPRDLEALTCP